MLVPNALISYFVACTGSAGAKTWPKGQWQNLRGTWTCVGLVISPPVRFRGKASDQGVRETNSPDALQLVRYF